MAQHNVRHHSGSCGPYFDDEFNAKVQRLMDTWHVPGLAIGLIQDSSTTFKRRFFTASTTKAFTAASVSLLVDDAGLRSSLNHCPSDLSWQTTLSSILGQDFVLDSEEITSRITLEDALSNRTGLPDHKFSFKPKSASVKDVVRSLRHLPRAAEPGTRYLYSSYMFSAVSHALETMTSMNLGEFMKQRLWYPLGMTRTYWTPEQAEEARASGTVLARGYAWNTSKEAFLEQPVPDFPAVSGAGAIISNVVDYAKWLQCMMTRSPPLSPAGHATLTTPRISFSAPGNNPFPPPHSYALGCAMYLPGKQWGLVMMGNTTGTSNCVQIALFMGMLDDLLETPVDERIDWNLKLQERLSQRRSDIARSAELLYPSLSYPPSPPLLPYQAYAGNYTHAAYGNLDLECRGNTLFASRLTQEIPMVIQIRHLGGEHWLATLMTLNENPRDHQVVRASFKLGTDNKAAQAGLDLEPALNGNMIWFTSQTSTLV
ncbi:hypothetical protein TrVFT333_002503 [Trichoderma virens FT-333]|nr:hypothetical protein TrVFT333_002503 [Trichoderma virens FT-333]